VDSNSNQNARNEGEKDTGGEISVSVLSAKGNEEEDNTIIVSNLIPLIDLQL